MRIIRRNLLFLIISILIIGCSYKEYDSENPDKYFDYWCEPENLEMSLPNRLTKKYDEKDFPNKEECLKKYK